MTNEANDIFTQARNGSVAAIIQVLNEKLTDSGVRTRAIFADGMLQLLCEGQTLDQLEQPVLVERIRYILEGISPRNIRRVNIYSRIVREQQLLWLDEINRDRENQVLWSEEITLKQPNLLKRLQDSWSARRLENVRTERTKSSATTTTQKLREKRQFWRGLLGGAIASGLLIAGWVFYQRFNDANETNPVPTSVASNSGASSNSPSPPASPATAPADSFANAVRLAERTSRSSQTAKSAADWLNLAAQWQQASDFMAQVPASDARYQTAQNRVIEYRKNSEIALQKARQVQSTAPNSATPAL